MTDKFNGFSQEEIKKISSNKVKFAGPAAADGMKQAFRGHSGIRRMPEKLARLNDGFKKHQHQSKPPQLSTKQKGATGDAGGVEKPVHNDTIEEMDLDRSMSKSIEEALFYMPMKKTPITTNGVMTTATTSSPAADSSSILHGISIDQQVSSSNPTLDDTSILSASKPKDVELTTASSELNVDSPFKGISLKDFESHRKMIQEQNKQKKELLYKAIEHHSQKTAAEARKIEEIKNELAKLDNDLAVDVAILRKQIDNACLNFSNIEKQYIKIEAQFLKAKIDLHNAAEKKELLTEHLCTVIAHNEDRKAQKLSELMHKVGITESDDYVSSTGLNTENIDK